LLVFGLLSAFSVAIGADSDADAGGVNADTAAISITATLDITLASWSLSVGITGLTDNDTALTTLAPALACLIANHADVLNVALRRDRYARGERCR